MLPKKYKQYRLIETIDGVSDTVYLLDDKYVLKVFEQNTSTRQIKNEQILLDKLTNNLIPKIVDRCEIEGKMANIYTQINGKSINNASNKHLNQIGLFLKKFHGETKAMKSTNKKIFEKKYLKKLIPQSNDILNNYFGFIDIELKNDGIIHGDIFPDNVKFKDDKLSGVYDFSEACEGDFMFDLAVIASSWCFDGDSINIKKLSCLLQGYGIKMEYEIFKNYIKYALLYYATIRYIDNRDFRQLTRRIEKL